MKKILLTFLFFIVLAGIQAQDFAGPKVGIANFAQRLYNAQPFDGVKILQTEDGNDYMISVVSLAKDSSRPAIIESRIASIKAKSYASQYFNGSDISSEVIIISSKEKGDNGIITKKTDMQEILKETSIGFVSGLELLINFESNDGKSVVFIFYRDLKK